MTGRSAEAAFSAMMTTAAVASLTGLLGGAAAFAWLAPRHPQICADCTSSNFLIGVIVAGAVAYTCAAFAIAGLVSATAAMISPHWTIKAITRWSVVVGTLVPPLLAWLLW